MNPSVFETNISFHNNLRRMFTDDNLIAVPTGKRIQLAFTGFNVQTETRVDVLFCFREGICCPASGIQLALVVQKCFRRRLSLPLYFILPFVVFKVISTDCDHTQLTLFCFHRLIPPPLHPASLDSSRGTRARIVN
jgi:hypothetical protein